MKTVISVPDDLFQQAETAARGLGISRSQPYASAITEFPARQRNETVTERLNEVYSRRIAKVNPLLHRAQLGSVDKGSW